MFLSLSACVYVSGVCMGCLSVYRVRVCMGVCMRCVFMLLVCAWVHDDYGCVN